MTFGKPRFTSRFDWELLRFASRVGCTVAGGASRLFKSFRNNSPGTIISYADRQYGGGDVYPRLGFTKAKSTPPSYHYTLDYRTFYHRSTFQKHKLPKLLEDFCPIETEWENMSRHGWDRIWDCGTNVYIIET
jgi:hypothetical protein